MTGYENVVAALEAKNLMRTTWGTTKSASCPGPLHASGDQRPSLSVSEGDNGKALLFCHVGCSVVDIAGPLGLSLSDLFSGKDGSLVSATYEYTDEDSHPLYRVQRTDPKGFWQERYENGKWVPGLHGTRRVLFELPRLIAGVKLGKPVYVVEGEKDVRVLQQLGHIATTTVGGAGHHWKDDYSPPFQGAVVYIIADNDAPGIKHARNVEASLLGVARSVRVFVAPEGCKDVTDVINKYEEFNNSLLVELEPEPLDILGPLDWEEYEAEATDWLYKPYLPAGGRVLAFGPPGSLKSLWAMWVAAHLSCEGYKVAYFSLEMRPSETAKRLKQLTICRSNFQLFTKFNFRSSEQLLAITKGLRDTDLIVVDSWSAAHNDTNNNDEVAALDADVFQPIIDATGATLLILDNVGHATTDSKGETHAPTHARGASAKGDKMEVTIGFTRPDPDNNYRTRLTVHKMRLDAPMPPSEVVETVRDRIEFYDVSNRMMTGSPVWPNMLVQPENVDEGNLKRTAGLATAAPSQVSEGKPVSSPPAQADPVEDGNVGVSLTVSEQLALARVKGALGAVEI